MQRSPATVWLGDSEGRADGVLVDHAGMMLTDAERCLSSLTRQRNQAGSASSADPAGRSWLGVVHCWNRQITHGQLTEVFRGLEMPQLNVVPVPARMPFSGKLSACAQTLIFSCSRPKASILFTTAHALCGPISGQLSPPRPPPSAVPGSTPSPKSVRGHRTTPRSQRPIHRRAGVDPAAKLRSIAGSTA
jgi:hypothetical protein